MSVDIMQYRAAIGLFNINKIKLGKIHNSMFALLTVLKYIHACISRFICQILDIIFFPFCMVLFLLLNFLPLRSYFPILDNFSTFRVAIQMYIQISIKFVYIILSYKTQFFIKTISDWFFSLPFKVATMLT